MRYQGKLVEWNADKNFGFVLPNAGGRKIFVHINEFANRSGRTRPQVGDLLTFEVGLDAQKRSCALNVAPVIAPQQKKLAQVRNDTREFAGAWNTRLAWFWIVVIAALLALSKLPWKFVAAWGVINLITYAFYAIDKAAATRGAWRTPESQLHLLALLGGWPAAAIAQQRLRHKTSKPEFRAVFWFTVIANVGATLWFAVRGADYLLIFR
jgi:uncharacterized membrane protein YsdA (DUF1294 family)/cold shock CspA family protein